MAANVKVIGLNQFREDLRRMMQKADRKTVNKVLRRASKPLVADMKASSPNYKDFASVTGVTTKQSGQQRAPKIGVRVGVIKNDVAEFPTINAPALASVFEYGTQERFRRLKAGGLITGRVSTGRIKAGPWLRPAWDRNEKTVLETATQGLMNAIDDK